MESEKYRHELKYHIGYSDYLSLRSRLLPIMQKDKNTDVDGRYTVRSIYFDNYKDKALQEKINGVARREKFRIRYYNDNLSYIVLEKKMKINSLCQKRNVQISEEKCRKLLSGDTGWMLEFPNKLVHELYVKMKNEQLYPKVLVSYIREPYVYKAGNIRVTFDFNIRSTLFHQGFLEEELVDISVADDIEEIILEVKYDEYIPDIIFDLIQTAGCRQNAFSKYCVCRKFG